MYAYRNCSEHPMECIIINKCSKLIRTLNFYTNEHVYFLTSVPRTPDHRTIHPPGHSNAVIVGNLDMYDDAVKEIIRHMEDTNEYIGLDSGTFVYDRRHYWCVPMCEGIIYAEEPSLQLLQSCIWSRVYVNFIGTDDRVSKANTAMAQRRQELKTSRPELFTTIKGLVDRELSSMSDQEFSVLVELLINPHLSHELYEAGLRFEGYTRDHDTRIRAIIPVCSMNRGENAL